MTVLSMRTDVKASLIEPRGGDTASILNERRSLLAAGINFRFETHLQEAAE